MAADGKSSKNGGSDKESKLAQALRANLRRRKAGAAAKPPETPKAEG